MPSLTNTFKSIRELGLRQTLAYLAYQAGKRSGWYRLVDRSPTESGPRPIADLGLRPQAISTPAADDPARLQLEHLQRSRVRVFGALDLPLDFTWPSPPGHWTAYDRGRIDGQDIKFVWEPARFCWTADLARLAQSRDPEPLRELLAGQVDSFLANNPPYRGPHWASAQEAALRLIHLAVGHTVLGGLPDFDRIIAVHARRIPTTLAYARAQDNNHLLSEAVGLFTAGVLIPDHPEAARWCKSGWTAFNRAVTRQFAPDGTYMQQSTNYHRLALTLAIWMQHLGKRSGREFPAEVRERLGAAVRWLWARCDPETGAVPNLGPNDGAQLLPLSPQPYADFRPVLQAAARAFLGAPVFDPGPWDELGSWFGLNEDAARVVNTQSPGPAPGFSGESRGIEMRRPDPGGKALEAGAGLSHPDLPSRVFLRAVKFHNRPGHADQLHLDLWWQGINIAMDPGTYSYNADPPWHNALQSAHHHNTLTIDGIDQMTRAGRFLYVDRATGRMLENRPGRQAAEHDGYRRLGLTHRRTVEPVPNGWRVLDEVLGRPGRHRFRVHWLLPDWDWTFAEGLLRLSAPHGSFSLTTRTPDGADLDYNLVRAGEALIGPSAAPTLGWFSPTYGVRVAALSFAISFSAAVPARLEMAFELQH